jgi:dihydroorotate dehydrogenase electron transfer subunit
MTTQGGAAMAATWVDHAGGVRAREFRGEVVDRRPVMGDSWLITFTAPVEIVRAARAGQFVNILARDEDAYDPLLRRPFSVYGVDIDAALMTILVRPYGRGTARLCDLPIGSPIDVLGLLGNTFEIAPRSTRLLMVGGGVGAAPLIMLAREAVAKGLSVTYLLGAMNADGLLPASELPSEVEYVVATDDGSAGHHGFVTNLVAGYMQWADQIFACGPGPMFGSLRNVVLTHRMGKRPAVQVSVERTMACGVGACLGCVVETKAGMRTSCVEGPVFNMDVLEWS